MTEQEQPTQPNEHWADFTARLSEAQHKQLVMALGAGLREARKAAQIAPEDGLVSDAVESLDLAIDWLGQARRALTTPDTRR